MPSIVKSVRLPNDSMMQKFVEKQSNFSNAVRYLVIKYCQEHGYDGIEDLSVLYQKLTEVNMYGAAGAMNNRIEHKESRPAVPSEPIRQAASYDEPAQASMAAAPGADIPLCYQ